MGSGRSFELKPVPHATIASMRSLLTQVCIKLDIKPVPASEGRDCGFWPAWLGAVRAHPADRSRGRAVARLRPESARRFHEAAAAWTTSAPTEGAKNTVDRVGRTVALAALAALALSPAVAQEVPGPRNFPARAIHIVVPFPAGGPADIAARLIGQKMSEDWGNPVVVENRPGANTIIGAQVVARAAPDGYTLLMVIDSTLTMNQFLYRALPYDPLHDFAPITPTVKSMSLLAVSSATGPKTVKELIGRAEASPGKLNYGSGTITAQPITYTLFEASNTHIPPSTKQPMATLRSNGS